MKRPVFLSLFLLRLPVMGWVSILHRVSGALLFLVLPLLVWALSASLSSEAGFLYVHAWVSHPFAKWLVLGLVWALAQHFFAGLRHLALDIHWGVQLHNARRSSAAVLAAGAGVTLLAAWALFA